MKLNIHNELDYAKYILENGFTTKYNTYELKILAKYWKYMGYKPKERKELVYDFCKKNVANFSEVTYFKTINKVLNFASKGTNKLIIIDNMCVLKSELDYINKLDLLYEEKKFLFCMYMQNKLNKEKFFISHGKKMESNKFGGYVKKYTNIFELSKLPSKGWSYRKIIREFKIKELIKVYSGSKIDLLFINEMDAIDDGICEITIPTSDWSGLGYYYDRYYGEDIKECEICDSLIKITKLHHVRCRDCAKEMQRIHDKKSKQKARKKAMSSGS